MYQIFKFRRARKSFSLEQIVDLICNNSDLADYDSVSTFETDDTSESNISCLSEDERRYENDQEFASHDGEVMDHSEILEDEESDDINQKKCQK